MKRNHFSGECNLHPLHFYHYNKLLKEHTVIHFEIFGCESDTFFERMTSIHKDIHHNKECLSCVYCNKKAS